MIVVDTCVFSFHWESLGVKTVWKDLFSAIQNNFELKALIHSGSIESVFQYIQPKSVIEIDTFNNIDFETQQLRAAFQIARELGDRFQAEMKRLDEVFKSCNGRLFLSTGNSYVSGATGIIVHDLMDEIMHKNLHTRKMAAIAKAQYLWCVSETTKKELEKITDLSSKHVEVIYNGIAPGTRWHVPDRFKEHFKIDRPYFMIIGSNSPHKNRSRMLQACRQFPDFDIVIVGEFHRLRRDKRKLYIPRKLSREMLLSGLSGAEALLHASLIEGFAYPIVEAQAVGIPVVTSNLSCLPEIAGEGAAYCNPYDVQDIKQAIQYAIHHKDSLGNQGKQNAQRFSLKKMQSSYINSITNILQQLG
jgi:glycosyltransferase involved in cell wall biosynthesis